MAVFNELSCNDDLQKADMGSGLGGEVKSALVWHCSRGFGPCCRQRDVKHQSPRGANINICTENESKLFLIILQNLVCVVCYI